MDFYLINFIVSVCIECFVFKKILSINYDKSAINLIISNFASSFLAFFLSIILFLPIALIVILLFKTNVTAAIIVTAITIISFVPFYSFVVLYKIKLFINSKLFDDIKLENLKIATWKANFYSNLIPFTIFVILFIIIVFSALFSISSGLDFDKFKSFISTLNK